MIRGVYSKQYGPCKEVHKEETVFAYNLRTRQRYTLYIQQLIHSPHSQLIQNSTSLQQLSSDSQLYRSQVIAISIIFTVTIHSQPLLPWIIRNNIQPSSFISFFASNLGFLLFYLLGFTGLAIWY